ncbi:MAG: guanylate kinase [Chloroflexi bacterium]|nr:guanylate kinase [Chloroflexota bacterium]|tara:strand:+ start:8436 stop:8999 length:564 start_codon:yes stop_codon:yes gene_type:complete
MSSRIVVLSGPSGVGKDSVLARLKELKFRITVPATMTTRPPRPLETHGVHHLFVSHDEFKKHISHGNLLEYAEVYGGHFYGVPKSEVEKAMETGDYVFIRVDVQGAISLKQTLPEAKFIFLIPATKEELKSRLLSRGTEDVFAIEERMDAIDKEYSLVDEFDYVVENSEGKLDRAVEEIIKIMEKEK